MRTRLTIAALAAFCMLLGSPVTRAADTWPVPMGWDRTHIYIQFGEYQNDLMVYPGKLTLQTGELYRFVVINPSDMAHVAAAPEFGENVLTSALTKTPASADLAKASLAEGIVVRPGEMMEWYLVPVKKGTYKLGCAQAAHAEVGMHTTIEVL